MERVDRRGGVPYNYSLFPSQITRLSRRGSIVGGLLLGALGYWVGYQSCNDQPQPVGPNGSDCENDALVVGAVFGGVGVGLGYFVGRSIDR